MLKSCVRSTITAALVALVAASVLAETRKLTNSGDWFGPNRWEHGVPVTGDTARIGGGLTVELASTGAVAATVSLGTLGGTGTLVMTGGDLSAGKLILGADSKKSAGTVFQSGGLITLTYSPPARRKFTGLEGEKGAAYYARYLRFMKAQGFDISYIDAVNEAQSLFSPPDVEKMIVSLRKEMGTNMPLVIAPSGFGWDDTLPWLTNAMGSGHAAFWDITSSHDMHGPGGMEKFASVAKTLGRPVWSTELHVIRGPDDRAAPMMETVFRMIRAGFGGFNPWLSVGSEKKVYTMFRNVQGSLVLMRTYYIYRHLANTSNGGRYLASTVPAPLTTTAAFHHPAKRLVTVWVLNSSNAPVDARIVLDGRFASSRLTEACWWGPDNAREGTFVTNSLGDSGPVRRTIAANTLYCFSFKEGEASGAKPGSALPADPKVALVRVADTPEQTMTYGHDFERLWHFTDGGKEVDYHELAKWAVGECEVDYVRVAISGAAELEEGKIDWSAYDRQLAIMRALQRARPGIKFFASPRPIHNDQPTQELRQTAPYAPFPLWINVFENPFQETSGRSPLQIGEVSGTVGVFNQSGGTTIVDGVEVQLGAEGNGLIRLSGGVLDFRRGTRLVLAGGGGTARIDMTGGALSCKHLTLGAKHARTNGTIHISGGTLTTGNFGMDARGGAHTLRISGTNAQISLKKEFTVGGPDCVVQVDLDAHGVSPISVRGGVTLNGTLKIGRLAGKGVPGSVTLIQGAESIQGAFRRVEWLDGLSGNVVVDPAKGEVRIEKLAGP